MHKTMLKVAVLGSLLAGCQNTYQDTLVFIRRDFHQIGESGTAANNKFNKDKEACLVLLKRKYPYIPSYYFSKIDIYMATKITLDPKMAQLVDYMKACMNSSNYELYEVKGRSSG